VETDRINFILNNSSKATKEDAYLLEREIQKYPFSQVLRILLAKVQFNLNAEGKNKKLSTAAIYTSDRSALKKVIQEMDYLEDYKIESTFQKQQAIVADHSEIEKAEPKDYTVENESTSIFTEVIENLKRLKSLRKQFLFLERDKPKAVTQEESVDEGELKSGEKNEKIEETNVREKRAEKIKTETSESRKNELDEIIKKDEVLDTRVNAFFLKEIEKNEESKEFEKPNHVDQKKIIEKFIIEQPSIGSAKKVAEKTSDEINKDLSEKSTKFGDDLISENLAIILLKQGKKERAIDIYKKLIWKLPQKKAYFAARIEEIKK
jgi:hypothetical protein